MRKREMFEGDKSNAPLLPRNSNNNNNNFHQDESVQKFPPSPGGAHTYTHIGEAAQIKGSVMTQAVGGPANAFIEGGVGGNVVTQALSVEALTPMLGALGDAGFSQAAMERSIHKITAGPQEVRSHALEALKDLLVRPDLSEERRHEIITHIAEIEQQWQNNGPTRWQEAPSPTSAGKKRQRPLPFNPRLKIKRRSP